MHRSLVRVARLNLLRFAGLVLLCTTAGCQARSEAESGREHTEGEETLGGAGGRGDGVGGASGSEPSRPDAGSSKPAADTGIADATSTFSGVCPTQAPFDDRAPDVVENCTRRILIAVGNGMRRIVSLDDGATWIHESSKPTGGDENENSFTGVAVGRGLVITTGDGGVHVSRDAGATWHLVQQFGNRQHASGMDYGGGRFLLTRWTGGGAFSEDGSAWSEVKIPGNGHSHGAAFGDGKWAAIYNGTSVAFSGDNGKTWRLTSFAPSFSGGWLERVVFGNGMFVIIGQLDGRRAMTTDGITWQGVANNQTPGAVKAQFEDLTWDGKEFLTAGTATATSDGLSWKAIATDTTLEFLTFGEGIYFGAKGNALFISRDGRAWKQAWKGGIAAPFIKLRIGRVLKPVN